MCLDKHLYESMSFTTVILRNVPLTKYMFEIANNKIKNKLKNSFLNH